jgi:hypothetical protein
MTGVLHGDNSAFSRRAASEFCSSLPPSKVARAQGKPGADRTRGSLHKKRGGRTTGSTGINPGFSCADGLWLASRSSATELFCRHRAAAFSMRSNPVGPMPQDLTPASGRQVLLKNRIISSWGLDRFWAICRSGSFIDFAGKNTAMCRWADPPCYFSPDGHLKPLKP